MGRKTKIVVVSPSATGRDDRDAGKRYLLTELPAKRAEKWAARAYLGMARSGVQVPEGVQNLGFVGVFLLGLQALTQMVFADLEPLMDEMMECVGFCPSASDGSISRPIADGDIEEVTTLVLLRREILELHAGFTLADVLSILSQRPSAGPKPEGSEDTQTFPG